MQWALTAFKILFHKIYIIGMAAWYTHSPLFQTVKCINKNEAVSGGAAYMKLGELRGMGGGSLNRSDVQV